MKVTNQKYFYSILLLFSFNIFFTQIITGSIKESTFKGNIFANIIIKDADNLDDISEFTIARNGSYKINLTGNYKKIIIEANALGYIRAIQTIENPQKNKNYNIDFTLVKEQVKDIKEVIIKADRKPFLVKEDTVKYSVLSYRDGSERKIEDIIKKLPGIEVNEKSGEIKYKGKSIETVQLEGDDLFGSNYSLGTKNINVDMVEQVQAIENYSTNPLLKGIESGDKVALNLKLKKGKLDLSGNIDYGSGFFSDNSQAYNLGTNILGISKNYKSFGTLSYNNEGVDNTPFDYFGFNFNNEQIKEKNFLAKKLIPESTFTSSLDDSRANVNNLIFGNYNSIFKIKKKASVKTNLYYIQDKILQKQYSQNNILTEENSLITSDLYETKKKPILYRGDVEIKFNASKNSLLEYKLKLNQEDVNTISSVLQNNTTAFNTILHSESFLLRQNLLYTKKISEKKAIQVQIIQNYNKTPQDLSILPSLQIDSLTSFNNQFSKYAKNIISVESAFLGSTSKTKYVYSVGADVQRNPFISYINNNSDENYLNNFSYNKKSVWFKGVYNIQYGSFKISPSFVTIYLNQNLNTVEKRNDFLIEPELALKYKLNDNSSLFSSLSLTQKSFSEEYFVIKPLFITPRNVISSTPSLEIKKTLSFNLNYYINNLYRQFQFRLGVLYNKDNGNYFSNFSISENLTFLSYFYLPRSNENMIFNFFIQKYIPIIQSTIKLSSDLSISNYKNIVNNSDLRSNKLQNLTSEFLFKSAFDLKINFENQFKLFQSNSRSEGIKQFQNNSIQNTFKIILKPRKKWFVLLSSDYYVPNLKSNDNYLFLDASIKFTPSKFYEVSFYGKNLLNKKIFSQIETSDFSTTIFQSNLIQRYYILNISYNF